MKRMDKQRELLRESIMLRNIAYRGKDYKKQAELRAEQDMRYKKWLFYKGLNEAISRR